MSAFLDSSAGVEDEIRRAKDKLRSYVNGVLGKDMFVFERAISTRGEGTTPPSITYR